jgi:hypothetical protein
MIHKTEECWKPVVGYEGFYEVSNHGRVRSVTHTIIRSNGVPTIIKSKLIRFSKLPCGYLQVGLHRDGKTKSARIHRLVAMAFIPNPYNLEQINHKDENKTNNYVDNLEWCTPKYNTNYGTGMERMVITKLLSGEGGRPVLQYGLDGKFVNAYKSVGVAARALNLSPCSISECCNGTRGHKQAGGYQWKFDGSDKVIKNILPIVQYDLNGNEVGRYASVVDASIKLGIERCGIYNCIRGKYKQSHGFIWKREGLIRIMRKQEDTCK